MVDGSVAVKWLLPDPDVEADSDRALKLLAGIKEGTVTPLQPPHWLAEVAAVITRIHPEGARRAIELLYAMEFPVADGLEVFRRASTLSKELSHHLFDTLYHAVAIEADATLVSADERYCRKAHHLGRLTRLRHYTA
ncbi:MAG: type II toxin-antitoxin system VapC family toxin [Thermoanaerobaculia bacterium]